jgi:hypothetical protein
MFIGEELCLRCGVGATNYINNAIKLVKVSDNISTEKYKFSTKIFSELV